MRVCASSRSAFGREAVLLKDVLQSQTILAAADDEQRRALAGLLVREGRIETSSGGTMKTHTHLFAAILAGGLLVLSGCESGKSEVNAAAAIPVQTAAVEEVAVDTTTHYSATIEPDTTVEMAFKVDGYVESLLKVGGRNVQEGDFVAKGAVLARVRQSDYRAGLDASRAQALQAAEGLKVAMWQLSQVEAIYTKASLDAERATALYQEKALTKPDYDAARAQLDSTRAQVEAARKNVEAAAQSAGERQSAGAIVHHHVRGHGARGTHVGGRAGETGRARHSRRAWHAGVPAGRCRDRTYGVQRS